MAGISVVIPNYNHAHFIEQALDSVGAQDRQPDEIIVIDDASEDDSIATIERVATRMPALRLIRQDERRGVIHTLNSGLALAGGGYVCFLGADDYLAPQFLDACGAQLDQSPDVGFSCACAAIVGQAANDTVKRRPIILPRTRPGRVSAGEYRTMLRSIDNLFLGTVTLFRRTVLRDIGGFDAELGSLADSVAARRIAARDGFCFVPRVLGYWRIAGANYSVQASTDPDALSAIILAARRQIDSDRQAMFPSGYGGLFERRVRFGGARLVALDAALDPAARARTVGALVREGRFGNAVLQVCARLGGFGRFCTLGWLVVRCRPFSLWRLCIEPIRRLTIAN